MTDSFYFTESLVTDLGIPADKLPDPENTPPQEYLKAVIELIVKDKGITKERVTEVALRVMQDADERETTACLENQILVQKSAILADEVSSLTEENAALISWLEEARRMNAFLNEVITIEQAKGQTTVEALIASAKGNFAGGGTNEQKGRPQNPLLDLTDVIGAVSIDGLREILERYMR